MSDLDPDAVKIIQRLTRFEHRAYLVGGCVRDLLLERRPKDFDIGTSATPRQIKRVFRNCRIIGRRFRLAHIYFQNGKIIEVATFRGLDGNELDAAPADKKDLLIRDDNVFGTAEEDALRRDFTINSLFYDLNNQDVLDHADGMGDLRRKLIRTIGDPEIRFREDPIRILRAIKFAARLGFGIESKTLDAVHKTRDEVPKAAAPRVLEEINRFGREGAARRSFELLKETGVFDVILPEVAEDYADRQNWSMLLELLDAIDAQERDGRDSATGPILAAILVPVLARRLGWGLDGTVEPPQELDLRETIDERLRSIALRLRVSRRDQERSRLIVATLWRLVPQRRMRRGSVRALQRRTSFGEALGFLERLAAARGGDFARAHEFWSNARAGSAADAKPEPAAEIPAGTRRKRRRRRRPGVEPSRKPPERPRGAKDEALPPVWDDDYFFAALPSVPQADGKETKGDRYGAASVASPSPPEAGQSADEPQGLTPADDSPPPGRRRRRPRRRRRAEQREESGAGEPAADARPDGAGDDKS